MYISNFDRTILNKGRPKLTIFSQTFDSEVLTYLNIIHRINDIDKDKKPYFKDYLKNLISKKKQIGEINMLTEQ